MGTSEHRLQIYRIDFAVFVCSGQTDRREAEHSAAAVVVVGSFFPLSCDVRKFKYC